jgi:ABC-type Fe3+-hydroxamate transport system substrate-binding protein
LVAALLSGCETTAPESAAESDATPPAQAALPEIEVDDDPERLIGLGPAGLNALLGQPELIRREAPAQIWQYRADGCVFDVVLYEEAYGERVTYVEARDGRGNRTETRPCLNALLRARLTDTSG